MTDLVRLDATALRVLAHPLRSRLLAQLRLHGPATATDLADVLDTNTGATSYHLRKLESVGLVTDTGTGAGKRRVWEASSRGHEWEPERLRRGPGRGGVAVLAQPALPGDAHRAGPAAGRRSAGSGRPPGATPSAPATTA